MLVLLESLETKDHKVTPVLMVRQANLVQMALTELTVKTERLEMTEQKENKEKAVKLEKMAHQDSPVHPVLLETRDHLDLPGINRESKENLERKVYAGTLAVKETKEHPG